MNETAQPSITDWITAISAFASAIILLFYTIYTRKMQQAIENQVKEQVRQTEELIHQRRLGILPYLVASVKDNDIELANIGNGTALNIEIIPKITSQILSDVNKITYEFEKIPMLSSKEKHSVLFNNTSDRF